MAYKLELHIVATGSKEALEFLKSEIICDLKWERDVDNCEVEMAGGLVEITDGEENSESVPDGK